MMRTSLAFLLFALLLVMGAIAPHGYRCACHCSQTVVQALLHFDPRNFDHNVIVRLRLIRLAAAMVTEAAWRACCLIGDP